MRKNGKSAIIDLILNEMNKSDCKNLELCNKVPVEFIVLKDCKKVVIVPLYKL